MFSQKSPQSSKRHYLAPTTHATMWYYRLANHIAFIPLFLNNSSYVMQMYSNICSNMQFLMSNSNYSEVAATLFSGFWSYSRVWGCTIAHHRLQTFLRHHHTLPLYSIWVYAIYHSTNECNVHSDNELDGDVKAKFFCWSNMWLEKHHNYGFVYVP